MSKKRSQVAARVAPFQSEVSPAADPAAALPAAVPAAPPRQREAPAVPPTLPSRELMVFPNPQPGRDYVLRFRIDEFTCLCPLTGQPDFARFLIEMVCDERCIELKSLKLYLWSYRNEGAFHEKVTNAILDDIVKAVAPRFARITATWNVRGGIHTDVVAEHRQPGWTPAPPVVLPAADGLAG